MNINLRTIFLASLVSMTSTTAWAQYQDTNRYQSTNPAGCCEDGRCRLNQQSNDRSIDRNLTGVREYVRDRYQGEMDRMLNGYDYRAPLDSAVEDRFRAPLLDDDFRQVDPMNGAAYRGSRTGQYDDRRMSGQRNGQFISENRGRLENPFRVRDSSWETPTYRNQAAPYQAAPYRRDLTSDDRYRSSGYSERPLEQTRYRIPLSNSDYRDWSSDSDGRFRDPFVRPSQNPSDRVDYLPAPPTTRPSVGRNTTDPFVPPLPVREGNDEAQNIFKAITARYSNPVTLRAIQTMSAGQALNLYQEVSTQTDRRHLKPSNYDLRVRRGLRNLQLALENPAFLSSNRLQQNGFRLDSMRTSLARLESQARIAGQSDAVEVVRSAMQIAQQGGLNSNVVAFEFANSTIETLDKFSALEPSDPARGASLSPALSETRSAAMESEIVGIGVEIKEHNTGLLIMKALRSGPAAEAGLKSGDVITAIDGRSITGMPLANSVDLMKGSNGSRIQLSVVRNGSAVRKVNLARRRVRIYTVNDMKMLPQTNKVAYLSLSQFGQKSTQEMDEALNGLYKEGMKSLIVDLRGNPGGLLNVCVDITNRFLPCGTIVSTKGRLSSDNMLETADFTRTWSTPLVVLIDEGSASASEIFAAAVQDNQRGIVIGERSYGKGTVQTHFPLSSISGNLRLTTARFYSPSGRAMSGQGVTPDINIEDADGPANGDRVLQEAIQVAQSQRLKDIASAARSCKPSYKQPQRNSLRPDQADSIAPKTVWK